MSCCVFRGSDLLQLCLAVPVVAYCGRRFLRSMLRPRFTMDTLIGMGVSTAFGLSVAETVSANLEGLTATNLYYESATVITSLILFGKYLETRANLQASEAIQRLVELQPQSARVRREDGQYHETPIDDVRTGDMLLIRPGVPVDGHVVDGVSCFDESTITGENVPVDKKTDDHVFAGSLNAFGGKDTVGGVIMKAEKPAAESFIAQLVQLVELAQASKPPIQRLADYVSGLVVPGVLTIAAATFLGWRLKAPYSPRLAVKAALSVLVTACPCALGLATPTAITVTAGRCASSGVLVRRAESLERAKDISVLLIDKTGTLTETRPVVARITVASNIEEQRFLELLGALEARSEHPLAAAVVDFVKASGTGIHTDDIREFSSTTGRGVRGVATDGTTIVVGSEEFLRSSGISIDAELQVMLVRALSVGNTVVLAAIGSTKQANGLVEITSQLKPSAKPAIARLKAMHIRPIIVSGDRQEVVQSIAAQLGIEAHAQVDPVQKLALVKSFQDRGMCVAMIGDGVNDAAALAHADVSFAVGAGTDVAMRAADITIISGDLEKIPYTIEISRQTIRVIRQNLFFSFAYNALAIPAAALGWLSPMVAAGAMALSSVSVITNSLRLRGMS